ncbi:hypothetical protein SKAU_G00322390 [Synaphobranchus kaupii]|uniref:Uncharacterized protein n=1 Tax=Synaphobranchus kaupii TaxID=118154 RepID=A0A9Q1ENW9_SYNKA|nr:hypothetical protein SKAU_G00322390 [Synaphobranchus kaupii]
MPVPFNIIPSPKAFFYLISLMGPLVTVGGPGGGACVVQAADVGNRITELSKVMARLHSEMKQIHQNQTVRTAYPDAHGSSILGKYIMGAKNNFRDFDNIAVSESGPIPMQVEEKKTDGVNVEEKKTDGVKVEKKTDGVKVEEKKEEKCKAKEKVPEEDGTSPTNSSSSQDTGFGSQEGEGSIVAPVKSGKLKKFF